MAQQVPSGKQQKAAAVRTSGAVAAAATASCKRYIVRKLRALTTLLRQLLQLQFQLTAVKLTNTCDVCVFAQAPQERINMNFII